MQFHIYESKTEQYLGNILMPTKARVISNRMLMNRLNDSLINRQTNEFVIEYIDGRVDKVLFSVSVNPDKKSLKIFEIGEGLGSDLDRKALQGFDMFKGWLSKRCIPLSARHKQMLFERIGVTFDKIFEVAQMTNGRVSYDKNYLRFR